MAGNYTRRINLYINGAQVRNDITSISNEFRKLERRIRTLQIGSKEYNREMAKLKYLRTIIDDHNAALRNTQLNLTTLKGLANAFNKYWPVIMGTVGAISGLVFGTKRASEEFAEFDDKLSDIMKVTGMTRTQVLDLNKALLKLDTRTAQNDLLDLAWVAGKLGYTSREDILGFVNAADKIAVALAKDLGGNAEDALKAVGKAVEIFDLKRIYGIEEAMIRVGSSINVLGMASVAQEGYLLSFLERVAGIAPLADVSAQDIMGLAAALDIYGQKSEVSATAYTKLMSKMATETEAMAKVMGLTMDEYEKMFREDANETMLRLFETLKGEGTDAFGQLVNLLGETELDGQRMNQVMGTLVKNVARIREQQLLSNKAFDEGTSVVQEFDIKNNNAKANLEKKEKQIKALRIEMGERLIPVYLETLSVYEKFIYATTSVIEFLFRNARGIISLISAIAAYRIALFASNALQRTTIMLTGLNRVAVLTLHVAYNRLTGNAIRAAAATKLLNAAMVATPWPVIIASVASLISYMIAYSAIREQTNDLESASQRVEKQVMKDYSEKEARIKLLTKAIENENLVLSYRKAAIEELKSIVPEYHGYLDEEGRLINSNTESIETYLKSFKKQIRVQALKDEFARLYTEEMEVGKLLSEAKMERDRLAEELAQAPVKASTKKSLEPTIFAAIDKKINELSEKYNKIQSELRGIEIGINAEFVKTPGSEDPDDPSGKDKEEKIDYSEQAEANARIAAKRKYQKGIIKTQIDLETELDKIALRFMKGRLSQMDQKAAERAELQEKIVDQELKMARDKQKQLEAIESAGLELSPVQKADKEFNDELKKLNIFHKKQQNLTTNELLAYQALKEKHQNNIDKIDAEATKKEIERRETAFETALSQLKLSHVRELDQMDTFEKAMDWLRSKYSDEELKNVKTLNDARLLIQKTQQEKEADLAVEHIESLMKSVYTAIETGQFEGVALADSIMSTEEWQVLNTMLQELINRLQQIKKERREATGEDKKEKEDEIKLRGKFKTDILGFTPDDWNVLFKNLKDGKLKVEDFAMAAYAVSNAWADINQIMKNSEDTALQRYESSVNRKKELLSDQLEAGIISQEQYDDKTEQLDKKVEHRKAVLARKQAVRDRNVALFNAVINMAAAIAEANPNVALMALAGAAGALQIGIIASTPLPEIPGLETGGYFDIFRQQDRKKFKARLDPRKRGWINAPTVLTGEKPGSREYVIPDEAMDNPSIKGLIDILEMARISHNLKTIDLDSIIPSMPGRAKGGFLYQDSNAQNKAARVPAINPAADNADLASAINTLNHILSSGKIKARLVYQDWTDMEESANSIEDLSSI